MRIHMILFTILIVRPDVVEIEKSKRRSRQIQEKIKDGKSRYSFL